MRKFLSLSMIFIIIVMCFVGCSEAPKAESRKKLAETLLQAIYSCDTELVERCAPEVLFDYYKRAIRNMHIGGNSFDVIDYSLEYDRELRNEEIIQVEDDFKDELDVSLSIDEAHRYKYEISVSWYEDGEFDERDYESYDDDHLAIYVVKIHGAWYAIFYGD